MLLMYAITSHWSDSALGSMLIARSDAYHVCFIAAGVSVREQCVDSAE